MANRAYFSMINLLKSRTIHKNIYICILFIYTTTVPPNLCYGCETWTMLSRAEEMLHTFDRKILRWIYNPIKDDMGWRVRYNTGIYDVCIDTKVTFVKFRTMQRARHAISM
jgi:hypothetical protein